MGEPHHHHDHSHAHDHGHHHHHDHSHSHSHSHSHGHGDYFLEQLFTVGICGAFGVVAVLMYLNGNIRYVLAEQFHILGVQAYMWVLISGIVLLALTAVRGVALWQSAGGPAHHYHHHEPGHTHGPDCDHGHDHPQDHGDHSHEDHQHGSIFWRVIILMFPIVLFVLGMPNQGFSQGYAERQIGPETELGAGGLKDVQAKGGAPVLDFNDIASAANDAGKRAALEGSPVQLRGKVRKLGEKEMTLFFEKMTCCAADTVFLKARIVVDDGVINNIQDFAGVQVTGVLQFVAVPGKSEYVPVIRTKLRDILPARK